MSLPLLQNTKRWQILSGCTEQRQYQSLKNNIRNNTFEASRLGKYVANSRPKSFRPQNTAKKLNKRLAKR